MSREVPLQLLRLQRKLPLLQPIRLQSYWQRNRESSKTPYAPMIRPSSNPMCTALPYGECKTGDHMATTATQPPTAMQLTNKQITQTDCKDPGSSWKYPQVVVVQHKLGYDNAMKACSQQAYE
mmetsp:Transcript_98245/g.188541  ORF Transcript_98245/g.188541 Transcript_98245/m.188541 type:complete len:123 (+) Transcript_98245:1-369(+)